MIIFRIVMKNWNIANTVAHMGVYRDYGWETECIINIFCYHSFFDIFFKIN